MKGERGYIVKVRFLTCDSGGGEPSIGKKDYYYFICEELLVRVADEAHDRDSLISQTPIKITNNKGYNYGGGKCIIIGRSLVADEVWKSIDLEKSGLYREIVKVEPAAPLCYDIFNAEAKKLSASKCLIDRDSIFTTLAIEGAMPKWESTDDKMKINDVEVSTSTSTLTNVVASDKWQKAATAAEVLLNGSTVSNSSNLYTQVNDTINWNNWGNYDTSLTTNTTSPTSIGLDAPKIAGNKIEKKEDKNMFDNIMKDMKFGPATDVKFSIYGPAFNGGDKWLARHDGEWVDVSDMLFDISSFCYMMPVAKSAVKEGDFILHKGKWARVECAVEEDNYVCVEKINEQEVVQILPTKNMFGFDYYTKLICPIEGFEGAEGFDATTDNPFGMLPFIMAMKDGKKDNLLPFMLMSGKMDMSNPMMLMMLGGDSSNFGLMMAMMAMEKKNK